MGVSVYVNIINCMQELSGHLIIWCVCMGVSVYVNIINCMQELSGHITNCMQQLSDHRVCLDVCVCEYN